MENSHPKRWQIRDSRKAVIAAVGIVTVTTLAIVALKWSPQSPPPAVNAIEPVNQATEKITAFKSDLVPLTFEYPEEWGPLHLTKSEELGGRLDIPYSDTVIAYGTNTQSDPKEVSIEITAHETDVTPEQYNAVMGLKVIDNPVKTTVAGQESLVGGWSTNGKLLQHDGNFYCNDSVIMRAGRFLYSIRMSVMSADENKALKLCRKFTDTVIQSMKID